MGLGDMNGTLRKASRRNFDLEQSGVMVTWQGQKIKVEYGIEQIDDGLID